MSSAREPTLSERAAAALEQRRADEREQRWQSEQRNIPTFIATLARLGIAVAPDDLYRTYAGYPAVPVGGMACLVLGDAEDRRGPNDEWPLKLAFDDCNGCGLPIRTGRLIWTLADIGEVLRLGPRHYHRTCDAEPTERQRQTVALERIAELLGEFWRADQADNDLVAADVRSWLGPQNFALVRGLTRTLVELSDWVSGLREESAPGATTQQAAILAALAQVPEAYMDVEDSDDDDE